MVRRWMPYSMFAHATSLAGPAEGPASRAHLHILSSPQGYDARVRAVAIALLGAAAGCASSGADFGSRAVAARDAAFAAATPHPTHLWRDTPPYSSPGEGLVVAYVEIPAGSRNKYEYRIRDNARVLDRVIRSEVGGYPINYGMIPGTIAFDGDPLDVLVLGPSLKGGALIRGVVVGLMDMDDEKGGDPKVVVSPLGPDGGPRFALTAALRAEVGRWFNGYKRFETAAGKWSRVTGWGSVEDAHRLIVRCRTFFEAGR